jgi:hypothetical protein
MIRIFSCALIYSSLLLSNSCGQQQTANASGRDSLAKQEETDSFPLDLTVKGHHYSVFYANDYHLAIRAVRPAQNDPSVSLCIAGAFTLLDDYSIDGLFIEKGNVISGNANHHLGGGLLLDGDSVSIVKTFDGKLITKAWADSVAAKGGSFFQQIQLVRKDSALRFGKDPKKFQRRAIVVFHDGKTAVVESSEAILLQEFANDLVLLGAKDALYTDMGGWDEGWYVDQATGKVKIIGLARSDTRHQSNWVVFERKSP